MARVQVSTQAWGILWQTDGPANTGSGFQVKLPAGQTVSINTTVYTGSTGSTQVSLPWTADNNGVLPGWIEEGTWILTINSVAFNVDAVSGATNSRLVAAEAALADINVAGLEEDLGLVTERVENLESYNVKSVEFGPGIIYNHGAIGDNAAHPLSNYFASLVAAQSVYPHATALTNQLDWAAIQKAQNACYTAGGGRVHVPRGNYVMGDKGLRARDYVLMSGDGIGGSNMIWSTDLGIGQYAISADPGGQHLAQHYDRITVYGPRSWESPTIGSRLCLMDGIQATSWCHMNEVMVQGFGANIVITGDHQKFRNVRSTKGFFNVYFGDNAVVLTTGDQEFDGCTFDFAAWANIAVHGNNVMNDVHLSSTHLGFAPYGCFKFDVLNPTTGLPQTAAQAGGGAVASTNGFIQGCSFDKVQWEEQGNACIHDDSTGTGNGMGSLMGTTINLPFHSWSYDNSDAYKIASRPKDYALSLRICRGTTINHGTQGFGPGNIATYHIPVGGITVEGGVITNMFSPGSNVAEGLYVKNSEWSGRALRSTGTCAWGDIMEKSLNGYEVARYAGAAAGRPIYGVAQHAATAGQYVVVATEGMSYVLCESVQYGGLYMIPGGGGVAYRGQGIIGWGMNFGHNPSIDPAFAISLTGGGAAGGALLQCILLSPGGKDEPGFIRPQLVSALPTASATWRGVMMRLEPGGAATDTLHICQWNGSAYAWRQI